MQRRSAVTRLLPVLTLILFPAAALAQVSSGDAGQQTVGERVAVDGGAYWNVSVPELQALLADDDQLPLVNVHIPFQGDIAGTDLSIPFNEITDHLDELPEDRDAPIVLYCRTGPMSRRASTELAGLGYTHVYNLVGGFSAWSDAGLPMENP